ncbi:hypothetical protein N9A94_09720, partial [Akkermansiaceae bacterium]|nr:hypothetical protein [Akkermansiaceae bacterium]
GLDVTRILKSSDRSAFVPDSKVKASFQDPSSLTKGLSSKDKGYDLVVRLSGEFETAFPDGNPADKKEEDDQKDSDEDEKKEASEEKEEEAKPKTEPLKNGTATGNLYLIADSDFLMDGAAYNYRQALTSNGVQLRAVPISGNGPFLLNIVDQANNSSHLIGSRARTPVIRPLTVFKDLEAEYEQKITDKVKAIQKELDEANKKLSELVQKRAAEGRARFTAEETQFYFDAQKERAAKEKEMREAQKGLQSNIDAIKSGIFLKSLLIVPVLVVLAGIGVFLYRRMSTQAR